MMVLVGGGERGKRRRRGTRGKYVTYMHTILSQVVLAGG